MTTLICAGTLFSDWQRVLLNTLSVNPELSHVYKQLAAFNAEICSRHFQITDQATWEPFSVEENHLDQARNLLSATQNEPLFSWGDRSNVLFLDLWKTADETSRFLLFYSSPEFELGNYFNTHPFDESQVESIIEAWAIRTRAMLAFFMNNRKRCLLVNVQSADTPGNLFLKKINEHFQLDLKTGIATEEQQNEHSAMLKYLSATLLLNNGKVAQLYDETLSTATVLCDQDKDFQNIQCRSTALIPAYLDELKTLIKTEHLKNELVEKLSMKQRQIFQVREELDYYYVKSQEQEKILADYLRSDRLLRIARKVRLNQ
jgi:low affinity Fe/Cu permease